MNTGFVIDSIYSDNQLIDVENPLFSNSMLRQSRPSLIFAGQHIAGDRVLIDPRSKQPCGTAVSAFRQSGCRVHRGRWRMHAPLRRYCQLRTFDTKSKQGPPYVRYRTYGDLTRDNPACSCARSSPNNHTTEDEHMKFMSPGAALAVACVPSGLATAGANAQTYPERLIRVIVPYVAGASNDTLMRIIGEPLSDVFRQPVVI